MRKTQLRQATAGLIMLGVYVAVALLLRDTAVGREPIPIYPSAGIAMAVLILAGAPAVPSLMLARIILLWVVPRHPITLAAAIMLAAVQAGSYGGAAALVRRKVGTTSHEWTQREVGWLIVGLLIGPFGTGAISIAASVFSGALPADQWPMATLHFALGDLIGELIVVPAALFVLWPRAQFHVRHQLDARPRHAEVVATERDQAGTTERLAQVAAIVGTMALAAITRTRSGSFGSLEESACLLVAFWIAQREGLRGAAIGIAIYGIGCMLALNVIGIGQSDITEVQATLLALSIGALVIGAQRSTGIASDARYWHLLATAREGVWRLDDEGRTLHVNERMSAMLGLPPAEIIGRKASEFIAPESLDAWMRERFWRHEGESSIYETLAVRSDGVRVPVLVTASAVRSSVTDEIVGSVALVTDLTELRKAESSDRLARQLVESSFRASHDALILFRVSDEFILDVNHSWSVMTGVSHAEAVGHSIRDLNLWADPTDAARLGASIAEHGAVRDFEVVFKRHNSVDPDRTETGFALLSATPVQHEGDAYLLVAGRDITADKRAADAARQLSRLEELGRLAGGVAHDFNNLLTVVLAYAETIAEDIAHGQPTDPADVHEIQRAGERGRDLTQSLLAFARHQPSEPRPVDVNEILHATEGMLRTILGSGVELVIECGRKLPRILADPSQLDQVLLNLAANARDAMPNGGRFTIRTSSVLAPPGEVSTLIGPDALPGEYVLLSASDTGVGMSHSTQDRIFEPFFTTKRQAEGTGLGLSVVFGIMRQARGTVRVTSEPGRGSTFSVAWPATSIAAKPIAEPSPRPPARKQVGQVLLVEDDPTVLRIVLRVLTDAGYITSTATHGQEALDHLAELGKNGATMPSVVLSDVLMPGISGHELARLMHAQWPTIPIVLMSGHTGLERLDDLPSNVVLPLIAKPFEVATLLRAMEAALRR